MKNIASILICSLIIFSCGKADFKKDWDKEKSDCEKKECVTCSSDDYQDPEFTGEGITKYVLEDFKYDAEGCITEGYVKYLKNGTTIALVKYWNKEGVTYGCKTMCPTGDCYDDQATCCKFEYECRD